jgi:hypothetical protein
MSAAYEDAPRVSQTLRFSIPSRSYIVDHEVLKNSALPLVEEFLLRLVAVADHIEPATAAQFFGLSDREFAKCFERLDQAKLVVVGNDGRIELSARAIESMRNTEGVPRFVEIENRQQKFPVDLISFQYEHSQPTKDVWFKHTIEIERRSNGKSKPDDLVRAAFEASFYELKKGATANKKTAPSPGDQKAKLHRITRVLGRDYFNWVYDTDVVQIPGEALRTDFSFSNFTRVAELESRRELFAAIRGAVAKLAPPVGPTILPHFGKILEGTPGQAALRQDRLDEGFFLRLGAEKIGEDTETAYFFGDFSQPEPIKLWEDRLKEAISSWRKPDREIPLPLIWLPPGGGLWARSGGVRDLLESTRQLVQEKKRGLIPTLMVPVGSDGVSRTLAPQRHKDAFTVSRSVDAKDWPNNLEVVLIPERLAAVLVHMRPNADCVVPIVAGFIVSDASRIERIEAFLKSRLGAAMSDPMRDWRPSSGTPEEVSEALARVMWGA